MVEEARRALGSVGAFLPWSATDPTPVDVQRDAVRRLERAGYNSAWTNEVIGKDALVQLAVLLAATERMIFGTGIANIWSRSPQTAHGAASQLAEAYPGRLVLGLGVGYPQQAASVGAEFGSPLATMRNYLDLMDDPNSTQITAPNVSYPRIVGANGPKMLTLAGEVAEGAMPAMVSADFTSKARQSLGPDKLLVILMDASVAQGDAAAIALRVREHLDAGADHVVASMLMGSDFITGVAHLEEIAPTLIEVT